MRNGLLGVVATAILAIAPATAAAAPIVVNTTSDTSAYDSNCTLREALLNAGNDNAGIPPNGCAAGSGADTITFSGLGPSPQIQLVEDAVDITSAVTISG